MKTDAQRIAHYEARMVSSLIDPALAAVNAAACVNFATHVTVFYPKQQKLRVILNGLAIPTAWYGGFEAFHGELYHLSTVCSGDALTFNASKLVGKWGSAAFMSAGNLPTLKKIALDLYAITIP
jgi:hypothetical protein